MRTVGNVLVPGGVEPSMSGIVISPRSRHCWLRSGVWRHLADGRMRSVRHGRCPGLSPAEGGEPGDKATSCSSPPPSAPRVATATHPSVRSLRWCPGSSMSIRRRTAPRSRAGTGTSPDADRARPDADGAIVRSASGQPRKADVIAASAMRPCPPESRIATGRRTSRPLQYRGRGPRWPMSSVLLMTDAVEPSDHVLPALGLLGHQVRAFSPQRRRHCWTPLPVICCSWTAAVTFPVPARVQVLRATRIRSAGPADHHRRWPRGRGPGLGGDDILLESAGPG